MRCYRILTSKTPDQLCRNKSGELHNFGASLGLFNAGEGVELVKDVANFVDITTIRIAYFEYFISACNLRDNMLHTNKQVHLRNFAEKKSAYSYILWYFGRLQWCRA